MIIEYKQGLVKCSDPANQRIVGRVQHKTVQMAFYQLPRNATWIGYRILAIESYPIATLQFPANRNVFELEVGDPFIPVYSPYQLTGKVFRIMRIEEESPESEKINIFAIEDVHYLSSEVNIVPGMGKGTRRDMSIEPLDYIGIAEAPYWISPDDIKITTLAGRKGSTEVGYLALMGLDSASYSQIAVVTSFTPHGFLVAEYPETIMVDDVVGFEVDFTHSSGPEVIQTISRTELFAGRNMALIGMELICFQTFTPVSGNRYRIEGIVRGMYDTSRLKHLAGEQFWFLGISRFGLVANANLLYGSERFFKYNPYNLFNNAGEENALETSLIFSGRAWKYLKPSDLYANGFHAHATYEDDVVLEWYPRKRDSGAGHGLATVVTDAPLAESFEGSFQVKVFFNEELVRTVDDIEDVTWTYTEAMNNDDNGGPAARLLFEVRNAREFNGLTLYSPPERIAVEYAGSDPSVPCTTRPPTSYEVLAGTYVSGSIADLQAMDGEQLVFAEVGGVPPVLDIVFEFTGIPEPRTGVFINMLGHYAGRPTHNIKLQVWNFETSAWNNVTGETRDLPPSSTPQTYQWPLIPLIDDGKAYKQEGVLRLRFNHISNGNQNDRLYFDALYLTANDGPP